MPILEFQDYEERIVTGDLTADGVQFSAEVTSGAADTWTDVLAKLIEPGVRGAINWLELGLTCALRADPSGIAAWVASTAYALGAWVIPTAGYAGYIYECTVAGTSGTTEPAWPTVDGATVADGTATWTCRNFWLTFSWQGRNKGGTFVDLHPAVTENAPSASFFERTRQGFATLSANLNYVPLEIKLIVKSRYLNRAKAKVKNSSYARIIYLGLT